MSEDISFENMLKTGISHLTGTADKVDKYSGVLLDLFNRLNKDCVNVPKKAKDKFVYFVVPTDNNYPLIIGHNISWYEKIRKTMKLGFSHIIFRPEDLSDYGIPQFASDYEVYANMQFGQLHEHRLKNKDKLYLTSNSEIEHIKARFNLLKCGKVLDSVEFMELLDEYIIDGLGFDDFGLVYQLLLDISMTI